MTAISERAEMRPSFRDRHPMLKEVPDSGFPQSVALIPDKNRTYARNLGLDVVQGYLAGTKNALKIVDEYADAPIKRLFAWGASIDNLKGRSNAEISAFTQAVRGALMMKKDSIVNSNRKLIHIGSKDSRLIGGGLLDTLADVEEATKHNTGQEIYLGFGYGDKDHEVRVSQRIGIKSARLGAQLVRSNPDISDDEIDSQISSLIDADFINAMYDGGGLWQDVDLLLRTYPDINSIKEPDSDFFRFHLSGIGKVDGPSTIVYAFPVPFPQLSFTQVDSAILNFSNSTRTKGK